MPGTCTTHSTRSIEFPVSVCCTGSFFFFFFLTNVFLGSGSILAIELDREGDRLDELEVGVHRNNLITDGNGKGAIRKVLGVMDLSGEIEGLRARERL